MAWYSSVHVHASTAQSEEFSRELRSYGQYEVFQGCIEHERVIPYVRVTLKPLRN